MPGAKKKRSPESAPPPVEALDALLPDVTRLPDHGRFVHPRPNIPPLVRPRRHDVDFAPADFLSDPVEWSDERGDADSYVRDGMQAQTLRKLRRGHWHCESHLDLHGHTSEEARRALVAFLRECQDAGARCVRIVHGKGLQSKNGAPVLKAKVSHWLRQREEVLAYCPARPGDGGSGAVVVLLKTRR